MAKLVLTPDGVWRPDRAQRKPEPTKPPAPQRGSTGHTAPDAGFLAQLAAIIDDDTPPDLSVHGCDPMTPAEAECWRAWQDKRRQAMGWVRP